MKRRQGWIAGATVLGLCLAAGLWHGSAEHPAARAAPGPTAVPAAASAGTERRPSVAAPGPAAASNAVPADDSRLQTLSPRARRMAEDWCGYGLREALKDEQAREAAHQPGQAEVEESGPSDAEQVMDLAREQVLQSWLQTLRSRGDLRSQAIADFLAGDTPSRAHLQDLARRSTDPMVTALALQRPCKAEGCRRVDAAQWSRLEPDNLMAWLSQIEGLSTPAEQLAYLIERMGRDAQRVDDYLLAFSRTLVELAGTRTPGLRQMAEAVLLSSIIAAWPLPSVRPVLERCQAAREHPGLAAHCERIALLMWESPSLLPRAQALALARRVVPPQHPRRQDWEQRALRYEASLEAASSAEQARADRWVQFPLTDACRVTEGQHAFLRARHGQGEWAYAQEAWQQSGESLEALAQRNRAKRAGRSVLDAPPAPRAASAGAGR